MRETRLKQRVPLTAEKLKRLLNYNPDTGVFTWALYRNRLALEGDIAGCVHPTGYVRMHVDGKIHLAHRLAWLYMYGDWPVNEVHHIDGNKENNAIANLADVTCTENMRARGSFKNNTSGVKGVAYHKLKGKWCAAIGIGGKNIYLGYFKEFDDAVLARKKAEQELWGLK